MNSTTVSKNETEMANSKDVVVTGVSTGIGWGTTKVLISKGFRVFGSVRKQTDADRLQREFGNGFVPLLMDVTDADAVHQAAQKVGSMIGDRNLVGLVNNAGMVVSGPLLYLRTSEYRRQLEVNTISPLVVIQAFAPLLGTDKKRQGPTGRVVNISSTGAKVSIPLLGAYSSSKSGLEGMSDALRRELMLFGIQVVLIEPGTVNTAMYDKGGDHVDLQLPPVLAGLQIKQWPTYHNSCIVDQADQIPVAYHGADFFGSLMYSVGVRNVHHERHQAFTELSLHTIGVSLLAYRTEHAKSL